MVTLSRRLTLPAFAIVLGAGLFASQSAPPPSPRPQAAAPAAALAPEARWQRAQDAWNAGHYPDALADLKALMQSPGAAAYRDRVALLTGELFITTDLTTDGRNPRISATGEYATYEAGPTTDVVTRVVQLTPAPRQVAELHASGVVFDPAGRRIAWLRTPAGGTPAASEIVLRDLAGGAERVVPSAGLQKANLTWSGDGQSILFIGGSEADATRSDVYSVRDGAAPVRLTAEPGFKTNMIVDPSGAALVYLTATASPFAGRGGAGRGGGGGGGGRGGGGATSTFVVVDLKAGTSRTIAAASASALTMSADGSELAWYVRTADTYTLSMSPTLRDQVATVRTGRDRLDALALSPDGKLVAYQLMGGVGSSTDWEIYVSDAAGVHRRMTRDIQHDLLPKFLTNGTLLGLIGEARHRRSYLYDVATAARTRVFANNTIRTISPEYIWLPSTDGKHLIIQAERDGDTVSAERGVYVVDLSRQVTVADVTARIDRQLADENDLRRRMTTAFKPLEALIKRVVAKISPTRAYEYEKAQFDFDSKHATQPGNAKAIAYLEKTYASFGYTPELQWFQPGAGNRTANIVSTLRGTENPDLIYVVSSHFDSVAIGPGADDDTSGTCALLETARSLAGTPLPATVVFASFTGEESGLLGSREFVRLAAANKWKIVGALNNDMIGWAGESARMDNTIRYSNAGIRDIQHGAAFLFTNLILYDAKYYKSTDAAAFYDGWGDIVGGIGSYPVLSNPNYHQTTDLIETINFQQVAETAKVTAATVVYLASSPSRLKDLKAARTATGVELTWTPSPEKGVLKYIVAYGPASAPLRTRVTVTSARAVLPVLPAGTQIAVKAVNARGLEGWDWARAVVQ
jgi:hypothetical protein